jgi:hypothetical protein
MKKDINTDLQFHILYISTAPALQAVRPPQFNSKPLLDMREEGESRRCFECEEA